MVQALRYPKESLHEIGEVASAQLRRLLALDTQSNANSPTIPSSEGQRVLSEQLKRYFQDLSFEVTMDENANLLVTIPPSPTNSSYPPLAFITHLDTSEGTQGTSALGEIQEWDGTSIPYPLNTRLQVNVDNYPQLACFIGHHLIFGPGVYPIGLDNKVGMAEVITLATLLARTPEIPHGELTLVFRPDEEIGRMEAVEQLVAEFSRRGIRHGYTIDGIFPFEINTENFNASHVLVQIPTAPLIIDSELECFQLSLRLTGVTTHGALAKGEGHLNSTTILHRLFEALEYPQEIIPLEFISDQANECNAILRLAIVGYSEAQILLLKEKLEKTLDGILEDHLRRGATVQYLSFERILSLEGASNAAVLLVNYLKEFFNRALTLPVLPEESEMYQGYSNPYSAEIREGVLRVSHRLRDFDPDALKRREEDVSRAAGCFPTAQTEIIQQYKNMGPDLEPFPELVRWAEEAAKTVGEVSLRAPIRGGTGVDPFVSNGIGLANLGTGYFAAESEKELTSKEAMARHVLWLIALIQLAR